MDTINRFIEKLKLEKARLPITTPSEAEISEFQLTNKVILPPDLSFYFKSINGTGDECMNDLYEFYSISRITIISEEFSDWNGIPDYSNICEVLPECENIYVFANYSFNLFVYAIKLSSSQDSRNDIFAICGSKYKKIANNFLEFIELYLIDSIELQLPD